MGKEKKEKKKKKSDDIKCAEKQKGTKVFAKTVTFAPDMKSVLDAEAKKRGMTLAGFIKYCVTKVIRDENL